MKPRALRCRCGQATGRVRRGPDGFVAELDPALWGRDETITVAYDATAEAWPRLAQCPRCTPDAMADGPPIGPLLPAIVAKPGTRAKLRRRIARGRGARSRNQAPGTGSMPGTSP